MSLEDLLRACADGGDARAWDEFVRRFHGLISGVVLRTAGRWGLRSPGVVDDLVQESYLKLCRDRMRLLREFEAEHPDAIYGYLKVIVANVVHDQCRALRSKKRVPSQSEGSYGSSPPGTSRGSALDAGSAEGIERAILLKEVDAILRSAGVSRRDRTIFWLYYRQGLTAEAIGRLPTIFLSVKGVESVLYRLTRLVRERVAETELGEAG